MSVYLTAFLFSVGDSLSVYLLQGDWEVLYVLQDDWEVNTKHSDMYFLTAIVFPPGGSGQ